MDISSIPTYQKTIQEQQTRIRSGTLDRLESFLRINQSYMDQRYLTRNLSFHWLNERKKPSSKPLIHVTVVLYHVIKYKNRPWEVVGRNDGTRHVVQDAGRALVQVREVDEHSMPKKIHTFVHRDSVSFHVRSNTQRPPKSE